MQKTAARSAAVFSLFPKNLRGGGRLDAPGPARVKKTKCLKRLIITDVFLSVSSLMTTGAYRPIQPVIISNWTSPKPLWANSTPLPPTHCI